MKYLNKRKFPRGIKRLIGLAIENSEAHIARQVDTGVLLIWRNVLGCKYSRISINQLSQSLVGYTRPSSRHVMGIFVLTSIY